MQFFKQIQLLRLTRIFDGEHYVAETLWRLADDSSCGTSKATRCHNTGRKISLMTLVAMAPRHPRHAGALHFHTLPHFGLSTHPQTQVSPPSAAHANSRRTPEHNCAFSSLNGCAVTVAEDQKYPCKDLRSPDAAPQTPLGAKVTHRCIHKLLQATFASTTWIPIKKKQTKKTCCCCGTKVDLSPSICND